MRVTFHYAYGMDVSDSTLLDGITALGASRMERAQALARSRFAPKPALSESALGMWFTRGEVPASWRLAVIDALGLLPGASPEAAA